MHLKFNPTSKYSWLIATIKSIIKTSYKAILPHKYKFENTREDAKYNTKLLKKDRYNFRKVLRREKGTIMEPGPEFRSIEQLELLLQDHENYHHMRTIMSEGVDCKLSDLPEIDGISDLTHMMERGNHESASNPENAPTLM